MSRGSGDSSAAGSVQRVQQMGYTLDQVTTLLQDLGLVLRQWRDLRLKGLRNIRLRITTLFATS